MRLLDLAPRYFVRGNNSVPVGISFDCPCRADCPSRLAIAIHLDGTNFDPDPDNPQQFETGETIWAITGGDIFENISLSPSINASSSGHWHGFVTNGAIV